MFQLMGNKKAISNILFVGSVVALAILCVTVGLVGYYRINTLQTENNSLQSQKVSLQSQITSLQSSNSQLQSNYNNLQSQNNQLNSEYQQLQSTYNTAQTSQTANLQSQIASLQSQLSNATALIAQLQGPTGILPVYSDLGWVGSDVYNGAYYLQLSLKNTGNVPITQVYVSLNSVQITMTFTYLNTTVNADAPLPSYQTATGRQNVSPPIDSPSKTYPLTIQALTTNGTIYTYQTTITSHV